MGSIRTEGVILHSLNFQDFDLILTVFTPDHGIIKCLVRRKPPPTDILTRGEFICIKGRSDLLKCREFSVISQYTGLRMQWERMETSFEMVKAIQRTQLPGKSSPLLYILFTRYLDALSTTANAEALLVSFYLKLLNHDGHLGSTTHCSTCHTPLEGLWIVDGESFCEEHSPPHALQFSPEEQTQFQSLLHNRSLAEISEIKLSSTLGSNVKKLFEKVISLA